MNTFLLAVSILGFCCLCTAVLMVALALVCHRADEATEQIVIRKLSEPERLVPLPDPLQSIYDLECAPEPQVRA
jgi:hypothetical protein